MFWKAVPTGNTRVVFTSSTDVALVAATVVPAEEKKSLVFKIPKDWKIANAPKGANDIETIELTREGDDITNWKKLLTIQSFAKGKSLKSPRDLTMGLKHQREKEECPVLLSGM